MRPGLVGVVTGAGSGLGRASAELLLDHGVRVAGWDISDDGLTWLSRRESARTTVVDVTDAAQVAAAADEVRGTWGRVDFLVNSAGIFVLGSLADVEATDVRRLFDINVTGTTLVTQSLLPDLIAARGAVVNLSSTVALKASVSNAHYAASKAAVAQLTRCWALELAPHGVRVNAVAPGPTNTPLFATAGMDSATTEAFLAQRASTIPLGRTGEPVEVARWITRFIDDEWITGHVLPVDGGTSIA
ncbi:SDR family NAD(P)-dependent oxidoreductase [Saccharopolyspora mangrovi]|uniref:SDR family oxidoreductase n=1 Tax=Saccharopolyspora mangrovi TaxID=3082379 RepID=A0ABU6AJK9_9PSEU|nr:SDR family oxidoreductase [Saccharopolyspora sp. S2-29]MEB3371741.1 SDR family oxidoreductase [Saccharopolyspora sp. S2-29]